MSHSKVKSLSPPHFLLVIASLAKPRRMKWSGWLENPEVAVTVHGLLALPLQRRGADSSAIRLGLGESEDNGTQVQGKPRCLCWGGCLAVWVKAYKQKRDTAL